MKTAWQWTEETRHGDDKSEARFTKPTPLCPHPERWTSEDVEATENEVLEGVVYGLIRALQPEYVIETGTHRGFGAAQIAAALTKNGRGECDSLEIDPRFISDIKATLDWPIPHPECLSLIPCDSFDFRPRKPIDFAWLDSGPNETREQEFRHFWPWFHSGTIVCFHDVAHPYSRLRASVDRLATEGLIRPVFLPTPRGVAICQVLK